MEIQTLPVNPAILPAGVPPDILAPIAGDPPGVRSAGQKFEALGHQLLNDYHKFMGLKDETVFEEWSGRSSSVGETAFRLARARVDQASTRLKSAGEILVRLAAKLEAAQDSWAAALGRLAQLKTEQAAAGPATGGAPVNGGPSVDASIKKEIAKAQTAIHDAAHAQHQADAELRAIIVSEGFAVSPAFLKHHPMQTIILEHLVADKKLTAKEAEAVAAHLSKLSKKDGAVFLTLLNRAGSESQRAALYKGLDRGYSVKHLEGIAQQYVNPFAKAHITKVGRIDQGVDYTGTGTIGALGNAVITEVVATGSGWEGGGYIQYRLTSGPFAGKYVFVAEGVTPAHGLHVGEHVTAGQPIAHMHGGMETGFAAGPGHNERSWARDFGGGYSEGQRTAAGDTFSHLLHSTGAPPGLAEGRAPVGHGPAPATVPPPHHAHHPSGHVNPGGPNHPGANHHPNHHHGGTGNGSGGVAPGGGSGGSGSGGGRTVVTPPA